MKWKNRLTNYNFWISIVSAVLLILQAFKINFDIAYINEIATAVLGLLVVIGIISDPTRNGVVENSTATKKENIKEEIVQENTEIKTTQEPIPSNNKDETAAIDDKSDIQTVMKLISTEIEKAFEKLNIVDNSSSEKPAIKEEAETQTTITNQEAETPTCYNIVN